MSSFVHLEAADGGEGLASLLDIYDDDDESLSGDFIAGPDEPAEVSDYAPSPPRRRVRKNTKKLYKWSNSRLNSRRAKEAKDATAAVPSQHEMTRKRKRQQRRRILPSSSDDEDDPIENDNDDSPSQRKKPKHPPLRIQVSAKALSSTSSSSGMGVMGAMGAGTSVMLPEQSLVTSSSVSSALKGDDMVADAAALYGGGGTVTKAKYDSLMKRSIAMSRANALLRQELCKLKKMM